MLLIVTLFLSILLSGWAHGTPHSLRNAATARLSKAITTVTTFSSLTLAGTASVRAGEFSSTDKFDKEAFRERFPYARPNDFVRYLDEVGEEGNFESVMESAYRFASVYPMYGLSKEKSKFLASLVKDDKHSILEIGTFFGFSTCFMLRALPSDCTLTCIEGNVENIAVAKAMVEKAFGKNNKKLERWKIIPGLSSDVIKRSTVEDLTGTPTKKIDFVFLDHDKSFLLPDLKILEDMNYLDDKATIVADNVIFPGAPSFLEYVKAPGRTLNTLSAQESNEPQFQWETKLYPFPFERVGFETGYKVKEDAMSVSSRKSK